MRGEGFEKILIISHRWEDPTHPDPACTKLKELKKLLPTRPDIEGVWLDFTCLPQGDKDKEEHDRGDVETIAHSVGVTEPRQMRRRHVRIVQSDGSSIPLDVLTKHYSQLAAS